MHLHTPLSVLNGEDRLRDRRDVRTHARAMLLSCSARSAESAALVKMLVDAIIIPHKAAQGQARPSMFPAYQVITEVFLADLLRTAAEGSWSKLSTNNNHLDTLPGGKVAFSTMRAALEGAGLLESLKGFKKDYTVVGHRQTKSSRTCFRPTPKLLKIAEEHGIDLDQVRDHFVNKPPTVSEAPSVLTLVASKQPGESRPKRLPVPEDDPRAQRLIADMARLNAFLMEDGRISGIAFAGLRRSFNNADHPEFAYQWHGRFYSMPQADHYERAEGGKTTRQKLIRIDGQPVVEVDISASHLTILHGLLRVPFDAETDPYGLDGYDREVVKAWLLLALGSSGASHGGNRYLKVKKAGLARYPFLADLPRLGIGPLDLHFHEAEIMRLAMEELMGLAIGFLPIHDALLVAKGNEGLASEAIREAFARYFRENLGLDEAPAPIVR